jgi:hypothetical protein
MPLCDFLGKIDVAIEALQCLRDSVAHLPALESPIIGMEEESREGGTRASVAG